MNTIDIQNMPLNKLRATVAEAKLLPINVEAELSEETELVTKEGALLQNIPLNQLKALTKNAKPIISLAEKIAKTGLSKQSIKTIETNKYKATIEEVIFYCKGLEIKLKDFMPEFFA